MPEEINEAIDLTPQIRYMRKEREKSDFIEWYDRSPENKMKQIMVNRKYRKKLKLEVLIHYGGNPPRCVCCGESHVEFLTIDHINNNGAEERTKTKKSGGYQFYIWLRGNNYPKSYQVLCYNCNCGREQNNGICPHLKGEK